MDRADYIAGWKTTDDWKKFRECLAASTDINLWEEAYRDFFIARLEKRYFNPIKLLAENSTYQGEGFSIVTIYCSLIEFLETTIQGLTYKYLRKGEKLAEFEYSSSKSIFIDFLSKRVPFNKNFDPDSAEEFYKSIRCGLLHEAQTKNGWVIHACSPDDRIIDDKNKVLFRNNLKDAFDEFLDVYKKDLLEKNDLKAAFIRKFDSLCN